MWAARDPAKAFSPPRDNAQYTRFLRTLIGRYGPNGFLWQANPGVRKVPVRDWQIWNEPNLSNYFSQQPFARPYARLLAASHKAVHAADRGARVVMAGLANYSWRELSKLYAAGVKGDFDVAAVHPFSGRPSNSVKITRLNREVMDRHGDRAKPIWLTELTWSSAKGKKTNVQHNWEVTEAQQGDAPAPGLRAVRPRAAGRCGSGGSTGTRGRRRTATRRTPSTTAGCAPCDRTGRWRTSRRCARSGTVCRLGG